MNPIGRLMQQDFAKGLPYRNQIVDIANSYDKATTPVAQDMQRALVNLIQEKGASGKPNVHMNSLRSDIARMAGSDSVREILQGVPLAVGGMGALQAADFVAGEESFGNKAMDLLGMGAGAGAAYGINRGVNPLGGTTSAGAALSGMSPARS